MVTAVGTPGLWTVSTGLRLVNAGQRQDDKQQDQRNEDDDPNLHPPWHAGARSSIGPESTVWWLLSHAHGPPIGPVVWIPRSVDGSLARHDVRYKSHCLEAVAMYTHTVPKLWTQTIQTHRREVRDAILDTTAALVAEHGLLSVTMSQIAEKTGIGRATLYKYFPDVEAILFAWHDRQITGHLAYLAEVRDQAGNAGERLEAVLEAFALISHESRGHHDTELATFLHRDQHVARAQHRVRDLIRDLLVEGARTGAVRDDVSPDELATYCVHALTAAGSLRSKTAVRRLVALTLAGLRPLH